ncbi:glycosyltransferase family 4 protein [Vibrio sp. WJH972]
MKILIAHNYYQVRGGEDGVMENEVHLLKENGNIVLEYTIHNDHIKSLLSKLLTMINVPFSYTEYKKFKLVLKKELPDVVHVHNYFPLFSPSIFYACKKANIPVVHTLHNYRAVCPTALLMHDREINERSIHGRSWWTVLKKVYRGSFVGTFILAIMVELHKYLGTWLTKVDRFITLTNFARNKYIEAGWSEKKVAVKPNFISDPYQGKKKVDKKGGYALYIGRLSQEKGIDILFDAWQGCDYPLKVVGDGPLKEFVEDNSAGSIEYLGLKAKSEVIELITKADFIVMPSTWYEGFPMVLVEAFACGTPALVSKLGSMEEIVTVGKTGLHFETGNSRDLAVKVQWMRKNLEQSQLMGSNARKEYLAKYTPEKNYELLMNIYNQAINETGSP